MISRCLVTLIVFDSGPRCFWMSGDILGCDGGESTSVCFISLHVIPKDISYQKWVLVEKKKLIERINTKLFHVAQKFMSYLFIYLSFSFPVHPNQVKESRYYFLRIHYPTFLHYFLHYTYHYMIIFIYIHICIYI